MSKLLSLFGAAVRERRLELNLSQEGLAEKSGLHRTYISDIERGIRNISLKNLVVLMSALEISIADFFTIYAVDLKE
jgi:transcriptional regulator with XRE-family HTH domain